MQLIDLSFIVQAIAFISSLPAFFSKKYPSALKILMPYLLLTLVVESLAFYVTERMHFKSNAFVYNFYIVVSVLTYLRVLQVIIKDRITDKFILPAMVCFVVFAAANLLFIQQAGQLNTYTYFVGGFLIAGFCGVFFLSWLNKNEVVALWTDPAFWLASGLLIYYLPKIILYASQTYLYQVRKLSDAATFNELFHTTNLVLVCVLYIFISINFLCSLRKPT